MIIDGKKIASDIQSEIKKTIENFTTRAPCLVVILVGNHPPSQIYVNRKAQACEEVGIYSLRLEFPSTVSEESLLEEIRRLNKDSSVDGILVQLPLPAQINPTRIMHEICPSKDVDGLHPYNLGKLLIGDTDGFLPCTPLGVKKLLEYSSIELTGKHALVIGRSNIVGKPMAAMLIQSTTGGNATVTVAHSKSLNLAEICRTADIIISAVGRPLFIRAEMVKEGAAIIDVGTNKIVDPSKKSGYKIVGDVDFVNVAPKCSYITPVPGGVGPMTIAMLLQNTLYSYLKKFPVTGIS